MCLTPRGLKSLGSDTVSVTRLRQSRTIAIPSLRSLQIRSAAPKKGAVKNSLLKNEILTQTRFARFSKKFALCLKSRVTHLRSKYESNLRRRPISRLLKDFRMVLLCFYSEKLFSGGVFFFSMFSALNLLGEMPMIFLNRTLKFGISLKPHAKATSFTGKPCFKRAHAYSIL